MVALLFFPLSSAPTRQGLSRTPSHLRPVPRVRRCALDFVSNPQRFFEACRKKHGDTFIIYVFGVRMLCTFSPEVRSGILALRWSPDFSVAHLKFPEDKRVLHSLRGVTKRITLPI